MKKKGFTLIELLAVIVVLAIIALIATPIVMNVINKANEGAAERSADNYLKAVDTLIATEKLDGTPLVDGEYEIDTNGKLTKDGKEYEVEVSGTKPVGGTITIENGQVVKDATTAIEYEGYTVKYPEGKAEAKQQEKNLVLCVASSQVTGLDFNGGTGEMDEITVGREATEDDRYSAKTVYSCNLGDQERIFYVLKEDGDNVKLIMNENLGGTVAWAESGNISDGPVTAQAALEARTSSWKNLKTVGGSVELPSVDLLDDFSGENFIGTSLSGASGPRGYWTAPAYTNYNNELVAGIVDYYSYVPSDFEQPSISNKIDIGIRPVITIPKTSMSI